MQEKWHFDGGWGAFFSYYQHFSCYFKKFADKIDVSNSKKVILFLVIWHCELTTVKKKNLMYYQYYFIFDIIKVSLFLSPLFLLNNFCNNILQLFCDSTCQSRKWFFFCLKINCWLYSQQFTRTDNPGNLISQYDDGY